MADRVRKVITRRTKRALYKFPSLRQARTVYCESGLEFDYAHLLEFDRAVLSYREQPFHVPYLLDGKRRSYTPDFLVGRARGYDLVEVKKTADVPRERNQALFQAVAPVCAEHGYRFVVVDGDQIRLQPRLHNVKLLLKYARTPIAPRHQFLCRELFAKKSDVTLGDLLELFRADEGGRLVAFALICRGALSVDLMTPLNADAPVALPALTLSAGEVRRA
ncbi:MAG: TnsA endonuclease N-terminal domain-containing protein [Acidobacteria bacterium]|nr:TnsA endonuclease N-terminal domain-containing protein [Acidobacteriota bacterium]